MKIVIGSESFAPNISGVATATELLATNLVKSGHQVWVFAPKHSFSKFTDQKLKDYTVIRFKSIKNPFRQGFRFTFLPKRKIFDQIAKIKPDIIHLQDPMSICSQLLAAGKKNGIPVVATNHFGLDYILSYLKFLRPVHRQVKLFFRLYLTRFYNKCDQIICPTETVKKDLLAWGIETPITAISNGVDLDRFFVHSSLASVKQKYHLPNKKIILYAGRVDKDKKIEVLVRAVQLVLQEAEAHFVVAGAGDELKKMKKLADSLGVGKCISWIGWIDNSADDLVGVYQLADIFAITSPIETQSIVTMEAMAAGKPVVGPSAGALPELIRDGQNGFSFAPGNADELAAKLIILLKDQKLRLEMGQASLQLISEHQIESSLNKTLIIYNEILKR